MSNTFIVITSFIICLRILEKLVFGAGLFADDYLILLSYVRHRDYQAGSYSVPTIYDANILACLVVYRNTKFYNKCPWAYV